MRLTASYEHVHAEISKGSLQKKRGYLMTSIIYVGGGRKKTKFHKGTEIVTSWRGRGGPEEMSQIKFCLKFMYFCLCAA